MKIAYGSQPTLYGICALTITDADITAAGSYWVGFGKRLLDPVAIGETPTSTAAGKVVINVDFGTTEAAALFTGATRDNTLGKIWVWDITNGTDAAVLLGSDEVSLWWAPQPAGWSTTSLSVAASQAWVTAAIATHAALASAHAAAIAAAILADHAASPDITYTDATGPVYTDRVTGVKYREFFSGGMKDREIVP
jgi:hypothetical protein